MVTKNKKKKNRKGTKCVAKKQCIKGGVSWGTIYTYIYPHVFVLYAACSDVLPNLEQIKKYVRIFRKELRPRISISTIYVRYGITFSYLQSLPNIHYLETPSQLNGVILSIWVT